MGGKNEESWKIFLRLHRTVGVTAMMVVYHKAADPQKKLCDFLAHQKS